MTRRLLTAPAVLFAISLAAPNIGRAQTFKVEKFDITAVRDMSFEFPPRR